MRHLIAEIRLLVTDKLLALAVALAPKDHPDSQDLYAAVRYYTSRMLQRSKS
jgi:hypothetical protein